MRPHDSALVCFAHSVLQAAGYQVLAAVEAVAAGAEVVPVDVAEAG